MSLLISFWPNLKDGMRLDLSPVPKPPPLPLSPPLQPHALQPSPHPAPGPPAGDQMVQRGDPEM